MDIATAIRSLEEFAEERGTSIQALAVKTLVQQLNSYYTEIQNSHREVSRQRRSLETIYELAKDNHTGAVASILEEATETLGRNIPIK